MCKDTNQVGEAITEGVARDDEGLAHDDEGVVHKDGGVVHKDGAVAWLSLLAGTLGTCLCSLTICTGLFHIVFLEEFGRDKSTTALVGGVQTSLFMLAGIIPSMLAPYLADHWLMAMGALCASTGFFVSSFLNSFWLVFLFYGFVSGVGFGIASTVATVTQGPQFDKYRNAAFGIVATGAGVGLMIFAPLLQLLLDYYSWRETLLIISGILLNLYVSAALMYVVHSENRRATRKVTVEKKTFSQKDFTGPEMDIMVAEKQPLKSIQNGEIYNEEQTYSTHESPRVLSKGGLYSKLVETIQHSKLCSMPFLVFLLSVFLVSTGMSAIYLHFPAYISSLSGSVRAASLLLTLIGVGNIFGRLGFGCFVNKFKQLLIPTYIVTCLVSGVIMVLVPYICRFFLGQCLFSLIFASFGTCFLPLLCALCIRLVGLEKLYMAYGVSSIASGLGQLIGPVFAGWCYDVTGSYFYTFIFAGSCYVLASAAMTTAVKLRNL